MTSTLYRLGRLVLTLLAVSFLCYLLIDLLPGDPVVQLLDPRDINAETIAQVRAELGLDEPLIVRYWEWLTGVFQGDWGQSFRTRQPALNLILSRLPVTIQLTVGAQVLALLTALVVGATSAFRHGSWIDSAGSTASFAALSIPNFVLALVLILVFAVSLGWLPATGYAPISQGIEANLSSLLLPTVSLAVGPAAVYTRVLRAEMISTLQQDYIELARAKGLPTRTILFRHALRPSSLPLMTLIGIYFGALLGGSFIVENIFALPGLGRLGVESIYRHDYLVVQGVVVFITVSYVTINYLVDALYRVMDPRVSLSRTS